MFGVPAPEIVVQPFEVYSWVLDYAKYHSLLQKWFCFDGPRCIFGQMTFEKIITTIAIKVRF